MKRINQHVLLFLVGIMFSGCLIMLYQTPSTAQIVSLLRFIAAGIFWREPYSANFEPFCSRVGGQFLESKHSYLCCAGTNALPSLHRTATSVGCKPIVHIGVTMDDLLFSLFRIVGRLVTVL